MDNIQISNLYKSYPIGKEFLEVLKGVNFDIDPRKITVVVGKSGCGKTTLLKLLCGLESPTNGKIVFPEDTRVGMVFQEARLMPWLTCEKNITFGLKKPYDSQRIKKLIQTVGLSGFEKAYPNQLSGGMQQRAALARTLACDCSLILMDEPFAALDYFTRENMQRELLRIRRESSAGVVFVTHSIDEALILGDIIAVMSNGVISKTWLIPTAGEERDILSERFIEIKREILHAMR